MKTIKIILIVQTILFLLGFMYLAYTENQVKNKIGEIEVKITNFEEKIKKIDVQTNDLESDISDLGRTIDNIDLPTKSNFDWMKNIPYELDEEGKIKF